MVGIGRPPAAGEAAGARHRVCAERTTVMLSAVRAESAWWGAWWSKSFCVRGVRCVALCAQATQESEPVRGSEGPGARCKGGLGGGRADAAKHVSVHPLVGPTAPVLPLDVGADRGWVRGAEPCGDLMVVPEGGLGLRGPDAMVAALGGEAQAPASASRAQWRWLPRAMRARGVRARKRRVNELNSGMTTKEKKPTCARCGTAARWTVSPLRCRSPPPCSLTSSLTRAGPCAPGS